MGRGRATAVGSRDRHVDVLNSLWQSYKNMPLGERSRQASCRANQIEIVGVFASGHERRSLCYHPCHHYHHHHPVITTTTSTSASTTITQQSRQPPPPTNTASKIATNTTFSDSTSTFFSQKPRAAWGGGEEVAEAHRSSTDNFNCQTHAVPKIRWEGSAQKKLTNKLAKR